MQIHFMHYLLDENTIIHNFANALGRNKAISDWKYDSIKLGNGLVPDKEQVIIWTNEDPVHWHV